jgi:hypothetical protein
MIGLLFLFNFKPIPFSRQHIEPFRYLHQRPGFIVTGHTDKAIPVGFVTIQAMPVWRFPTGRCQGSCRFIMQHFL